jgi:hypothetical protein
VPGANYSKLQPFLPQCLRLPPTAIPDDLLELSAAMGLLDKFRPQPRWKHPDPAIRLAAVEQLPLDDQDTLVAIAREDGDPGVRIAALRKVLDPAVLSGIGRADPDPRVRDQVAQLLIDLASGTFEGTGEAESLAALGGLTEARHLAAVACAAGTEAVARAALDRLSDDASVCVVARKARLAPIRMQALTRVDSQSELAAVALRSEFKDVAVAATERLTSREALEQVADRAKNKSAAKRARAILRAVDAEREAAARAEAEAGRAAERAAQQRASAADALCRRLEALAGSDSDEAESVLAEIERAWQALGQVDQARAARYASARAAAREAASQHEAERAERTRLRQAAAEAVAARRALCEQVDALAGDETPGKIAEARAAWAALPPLADAAEDGRWAAQFDQACRAAIDRQQKTVSQRSAREKAAQVCQEAERLAENAVFPAARLEVQAVRAAWGELRAAGACDEEVAARFEAADARLREREATARAERAREAQANLARLEALCAELDALASAADLSLRQAERAVRDARAALAGPGPLPTRHDRDRIEGRLRAALTRLVPRVQELRDLEDWKKWANAGVQEDLCRRVEQLMQVDDLAAAARQLRELQAQWKTVASAPRGQSQALWTRFKAAADAVRARCDGYFAKLAEDQAANAARKEALCQQAEALAGSTDWIRTAEAIKALQAEWKAIGPAGRARDKELWERFHGACDTFFRRRRDDLQHRKQEWAANLARREAICEQAEAVARSTEWQAGIDEIKKLQAEWKTIGPVRKTKADETWKRFRAACDAFYEAYQQRHHAAAGSAVAEAEQICGEIESLLPAAGVGAAPPPERLGERVNELRRRMTERLPGLPRDRAMVLGDRFQRALLKLVDAWPAGFAGTDLDPEANAKRLEALCVQVESLLGAGADAASGGGTPGEPARAESPAALLARQLREALATNTIAGRADEAARWKAVGEQLRSAQAAWKKVGPVPDAISRPLLARFQRACARVGEKLDQSRRGGGAR